MRWSFKLVLSIFTIKCLISFSALALSASQQQDNTTGKGLVSGHPITEIAPQYPPVARAAHVTGTVVLNATITVNGDVTNVSVVSGPPMLQQAAIDAVKHWKYSPYLLDGKATEVDTTVSLNFSSVPDPPANTPSLASQVSQKSTGSSSETSAREVLEQANSLYLAHKYEEAFSKYMRAADQNEPTAQNIVGNMYYNGLGVAKDTAEAAAWYRKAADLGNAFAQVHIGNMYFGGVAVGKNDVEAAAWYRKAADQGNPVAQGSLGAMYANGLGVAKNDVEAVAWYRKAADQGNAEAQTNLGAMYSGGLGVAKNDVQALIWYQKAADQGYPTGQNNLGWAYMNGYGVPQDYARARSLFESAATAGNAYGMSSLAVLYQMGWGVSRDDARARELYKKALTLVSDPQITINLANLDQRAAQEQAAAQQAAAQQQADAQAAAQQAAVQQAPQQQVDAQAAADTSAEEAQQQANDIQNKIAELRRDVESSQRIADQADQSASDMVSRCRGDAMCQMIGNLGAAKQTTMANKYHNQVDSDNEEIATLEGEAAEVHERRSTSYGAALNQVNSDHPTPTINDTLAQQQAQLRATAAAIQQRANQAAEQKAAADRAEARRLENVQATEAAELQRRQSEKAAQIAAQNKVSTPIYAKVPPVESATSAHTAYYYKGRSYQSYPALIAAARADHNCALHPETGAEAPCDNTIAIAQLQPARSSQQSGARSQIPSLYQPSQSNGPIWVAFAFSQISSILDDTGDGAYGFGINGDKQSAMNTALNSCNASTSKPNSCSDGGAWVGSSDGTPKWFAVAINLDARPNDLDHPWSYGEAIGQSSQNAAQQQALLACHKPVGDRCTVVASNTVGGTK